MSNFLLKEIFNSNFSLWSSVKNKFSKFSTDEKQQLYKSLGISKEDILKCVSDRRNEEIQSDLYQNKNIEYIIDVAFDITHLMLFEDVVHNYEFNPLCKYFNDKGFGKHYSITFATVFFHTFNSSSLIELYTKTRIKIEMKKIKETKHKHEYDIDLDAIRCKIYDALKTSVIFNDRNIIIKVSDYVNEHILNMINKICSSWVSYNSIKSIECSFNFESYDVILSVVYDDSLDVMKNPVSIEREKDVIRSLFRHGFNKFCHEKFS